MTAIVLLDAAGKNGFSQVIFKPVVDTTSGVKIRLAVKLPTVLLISMAVKPMSVLLVSNTGSFRTKDTPCVKTPLWSVYNLKAEVLGLADVITHVHTLCSLSPGHRP